MGLFTSRQTGKKATFRASTVAGSAAAAGTAPFFVFEGSATKLIEIQRIVVSGPSLTAAEILDIVVRKCSTAASGDAGTALTKTPMYTGTSAATANRCTIHTIAPTEGTLVGVVASRRVRAIINGGAANVQTETVVFDFGSPSGNSTGIVLDGVAQGVTLAFGTLPASAVLVCVNIEWTEENA